MRTLVVFLVLLTGLRVFAVDVSETACPAKCGQSNAGKIVSDAASEIIHNEYLSGEEDLLDWKDEWLDEADRWLLDQTVLNEDLQADVLEGKDRVHDLIDEVDTAKMVTDGKNIFTDLDEWFNNIDLTEARADANVEISNIQAYINDYKAIKDDFVQDNLVSLFGDYVSLGSEYAEENLGDSNPGDDESIKPSADGQKKSSRGKRAKSHLKSAIESFRNQYDDIVDEKKPYYEDLRDKYQADIDDIKLKKDSWREWARSWRIKEEETIPPVVVP